MGVVLSLCLLGPLHAAGVLVNGHFEGTDFSHAQGVSSDSFFRIFDSSLVDADRAACMGGEKVQQTYSGKTNSRTVDRMSNGYFYGMMMSFAQNVCASTNKQTPYFSRVITGQVTRGGDTLSHYGLSGDPLAQNYALMLPLGMIESSGQYNEGRDRSATNMSSDTTEAGLFQVSYNSTRLGSGALDASYNELMRHYDNGNSSKCMRGVFAINQSLSKNDASWGSGRGLEFQNAMKKCPALAVDYMAALLRVNHHHNGPLNRKEAQPRQACVRVLDAVKAYAQNNCGQLDAVANKFGDDPRAKNNFPVAGQIETTAPPGVGDPASLGELANQAADDRRLAAELSEKQKRLSVFDPEWLELNARIQDLNKNADKLESELATVEAGKAQYTQLVQNFDSPEFKKQQADAANEVKSLREQAAELRRTAPPASDLSEEARNKRKKMIDEAQRKEEQADENAENAKKVDQEIIESRKQLTDLTEQEVKLKAQKKAQAENLKVEITNLEKEIAALEAEIKALQDQKAASAKQEEALVSRRKKIEELRKKLQDFEK